MAASAPILLRPPARPTAAPVPVPSFDANAFEPARRRLPALAMLAGGLVLLAAACLAAGRAADANHAVRSFETAAPAPADGPLAVTLSGPGDVTVLHQTYEPGKDSGWHAHPGIHAVAILSGSLTIYDENCQRHTFGPGESYVGGQLSHLVRNESDIPVEMVVTYMNPAGPHDSNRARTPPAGCVVGAS